MLLDLILVLGGIAGLFFGGEWLVIGASRLARSYGVPSLIIGLTIVAFGTSVPELLVSLQAVFSNSDDISVGNIIGSNISNIGLIIGLTSLVFPVFVEMRLLRRELPMMLIATVLTVFLMSDDVLGGNDGFILLLGFVAFSVYMGFLTYTERKKMSSSEADPNDEDDIDLIPPERRLYEAGRIGIGLVILFIASRATVDGAVGIARDLGVSELVIGVSLVAIGTSLPELATSFIAALRNENDLALGNIVGSNIFNLLLVLGITSTVSPLQVQERVLGFDVVIMLIFSFALLPIASSDRQISRFEAGLLLGGYVVFIILAFIL